MNILVTGATGFLGSHLCASLKTNSKVRLTPVVRKAPLTDFESVTVIPFIGSETVWEKAIDGQDVVIHAAARAHIMKDEVAEPLEEYRRVNVYGTINLARQAAVAGVRRFIFISSIKVNGEQTPLDKPFTADDTPAPDDAYGISKWEAEQGLHQLASETGMEVVIIRPPLAYGLGVKGNFKSLLGLTERRLPLPLSSLKNRRSMVALDNFVDLIVACIDHPSAANETFLVSDDHDLSTSELLTKLGEAAGKPARLFSVPPAFLRFGAKILGKQALADRLLGNLQVDITHTKETLNWTPPITVEEGLRRCFEPTNKD